jgi:hypothetical protein
MKCKCGKTLHKRNGVRPVLCVRCRGIEHEEKRIQYRLNELADKKSEIRKWYKWICKKGLYEKSVRFCGTVDTWDASEMQSRCVLELAPWDAVFGKEVSEGPLKGMATIECYFFNGYFRLRTDRDYYPYCGKAGIPHRVLSGAADRFNLWLNDGYRKAREAKIKKECDAYLEKVRQREKQIKHTYKKREDERRLRQERMHHLSIVSMINARNPNKSGKKNGKAFFQMQSAAQIISAYAKRTNQ